MHTSLSFRFCIEINENISIKQELQPSKDLFTFLITQNLELTKKVAEIKIQMNNQQQIFN